MTGGAEGRPGYQGRLDEIRAEVVQLAGLAVEAASRATRCLLEGDLEAARRLVEGDDVLDELTIRIEETCYQVLALQNPMAGDLRAVVTALKLAAEFERCGDLAVNLAKAARRLHDVELPPRTRGLIERMSEEAVGLLRLSIDAYADGDAGRASALDDLDDELDDLQRTFMETMFQAHHGEALDLRAGVQLALVGRYYERLGDHAVNVAERVQYMVTGWLPEHAGAARVAVRDRLGRDARGPVAAEAAGTPAEAVPAEVQARAVDALDHLPIGVVICGADGEVVFRNRLASTFVDARHGDALVEAAVEELRVRGPRPVGTGERTRTVDLVGPPARSYALATWPVPGGSVITVTDVSEQRRVEALRRDFVANISHELRTPVGALAVLAETLADESRLEAGARGEEQAPVVSRLAERITQEADRLGGTIDDLLELSRLEAGEAPRTEPLSLAEVVAAAVERAGSAAALRDVEIVVAPHTAEASVPADRRQLVSAVANLLDNAVKYSDRGGTVELSVDVSATEAAIAVRDEGIGIPEADQDRVFERFYRVDRARRRDTGGTGLGLAIVRHVAMNHGGSVTVESREGEGATFTLHLPMQAGEAHAPVGGAAADAVPGDVR